MPPLRLLAIAALLAASLTVTPAASARPHFPDVGFGEQRLQMFSNPLWQDLGLKRVRYVVGWDALRSPWQTAEIDAWMAAARAAGARPLLALTRSRSHWRTRVLPSPAT